MTEKEKELSVKEAATLADVNPRTVRRWINGKGLKADHRGPSTTRIEFSSLASFVFRYYNKRIAPPLPEPDVRFWRVGDSEESYRVLADNKELVYLVGCGNGLYKIGASHNFRMRLPALQAVAPVQLRCEMLIRTDSMFELEDEFHARFQQARSHGEWFHLTAHDLDLLESVYRMSVFVK